jgi:hypothetical protein
VKVGASDAVVWQYVTNRTSRRPFRLLLFRLHFAGAHDQLMLKLSSKRGEAGCGGLRSSNSIKSSGESEKVWALLKRLIFNKLFTFDVGLLRRSLDEMKA